MTCAFCKACVAEDGFCAFRRVALHPPTTIAAAIKLQFTCLATTMDLLKCSEQSNRNEVIQTPHARDIRTRANPSEPVFERSRVHSLPDQLRRHLNYSSRIRASNSAKSSRTYYRIWREEMLFVE